MTARTVLPDAGPAQAPQQLLGDVAAVAGGTQHDHRLRPQQPLHRRRGSRRLPGGQGRLEGGALLQVHGDAQRVAVPLGPQRQPQVVEDLEHLDVAAQHQRHQLVQAPGPCPGDQVLQQERAQAVPLGPVVDHQGHLGRRPAHLVAGPHADDSPLADGENRVERPLGVAQALHVLLAGDLGRGQEPLVRRTGGQAHEQLPEGGEVVRADHAHLQHGAVGGEDVVPGRDLLHPATVGGPCVPGQGQRSRHGAGEERSGDQVPCRESLPGRDAGLPQGGGDVPACRGFGWRTRENNHEHHSREQHRRRRRRVRVQ